MDRLDLKHASPLEGKRRAQVLASLRAMPGGFAGTPFVSNLFASSLAANTLGARE
jgi:hypothetical protein